MWDGRSTSSLEGIAAMIVGVDPSLPMLRQAEIGASSTYVVGRGEDLPFDSGVLDILTVSSAFHWFDRTLFLGEARRVLRPAGTLVVYDNYFSGEAEEVDELATWVFEVYRTKYPAPPRAPVQFEPGAAEDGFRCLQREEYDHPVTFTREGLVEYLLTQTNVIAAVAEGGQSLSGVTEWLRRELRPFFTSGALTIRFGGPIWILRSERKAPEERAQAD